MLEDRNSPPPHDPDPWDSWRFFFIEIPPKSCTQYVPYQIFENKSQINIFLKQPQPTYKEEERYATPLGTWTEVIICRSLWYDNIRKNRFKFIGAQKDYSDFILHECTLRH